jgi:hypothetical protein
VSLYNFTNHFDFLLGAALLSFDKIQYSFTKHRMVSNASTMTFSRFRAMRSSSSGATASPPRRASCLRFNGLTLRRRFRATTELNFGPFDAQLTRTYFANFTSGSYSGIIEVLLYNNHIVDITKIIRHAPADSRNQEKNGIKYAYRSNSFFEVAVKAPSAASE